MSIWDSIASLIVAAREKTLGAALGALDRAKARRDEGTFSIALIALSAKMARADGVVTDDEIAAFKRFFAFPDSEAAKVRMVYDLAQQDVAGFEHYLAQVGKLFADDPAILEDVLDCLFHIALADGVVHPREMALLERAADIFKIGPGSFRRIRAAHGGVDHEDPWLILGLPATSSLAVIKARYRELMRQHHPDALVARGVPPALAKIAEGRSAAINAAYEKVLAELEIA